MRNLLAAPATARSVSVRVLNGDGHATRAGAEVRVYAAGTTQLLGAALVDSGSGYDAQNDLPTHIGLPSLAPVDVEVTSPAFSMRAVTKVTKVNPVPLRGFPPTGRTIEVRIGPAK